MQKRSHNNQKIKNKKGLKPLKKKIQATPQRKKKPSKTKIQASTKPPKLSWKKNFLVIIGAHQQWQTQAMVSPGNARTQ
jgi:hypothetical protein